MRIIRPLPPRTLLLLVNDWAAAPVAAAWDVDGFRPPADPRRRELETALLSLDLPVEPEGLHAAADLLFPVFAADDPLRPAAADAMLDRVSLRPAIDSEGAVRLRHDGDAPVLAAGAAAVLTLLHEGARTGVCRADGCIDAWVDTSPGRRRAYCSIACQNRTRQRAARARRADDARAKHGS